MEPLAPTRGISGAALFKGGSFLGHAWFDEQIFGVR
jgi:hypothetical protein